MSGPLRGDFFYSHCRIVVDTVRDRMWRYLACSVFIMTKFA